MKSLFFGCATIVGSIFMMVNSSSAGTITFGSNANQFNMEFVTIGNPGNTADNTGIPNPAGSVGYSYGIAKYEVSRDMITKYNVNFGNANFLTISMENMVDYGGSGPDQPATWVSWSEAARFVNWLNTSKNLPAAYKFPQNSGANNDILLWDPLLDPLDYNEKNPYRSKRATFVLPSYNEWYKAAYYDPNKNGGVGGYWKYATKSDTLPVPVASGDGTGINGNNEAVFSQLPSDLAKVNKSGGLSAFGVMGLEGNVWEWEESSGDLMNTNPAAFRGVRGGRWDQGPENLSSSVRLVVPNNEYLSVGFRVAMVTPTGGEVPEPTSMAIFGLGALGLAYRSRGKRKRG